MNKFENMILHRISQMFVVFFAKVEKHEGDLATVTPLFKNEYGSHYGSLEAPVYTFGSGAGSIETRLQEGDVVPCLTVKKDVGQADGERVEVKRVDFFHNLADTIILGMKRVTSTSDGMRISFGSSSIVIEDDKIVVNGNLEVNGDANLTGEIEATGEISSMIDVKAGLEAAQVSLLTHVHAGVQGGNSNTAPPTPSSS